MVCANHHTGAVWPGSVGLLKRLGALLLLLPLLASCSGDDTSPESRIRALLNTAEEAVESRSLSAVSPLLSPAFSDSAGQDKQALLRLLGGYFVTHQSIHLLTQVSRLDLIGPDRAHVTLYVAVAGQPLKTVSQLISLRAELIRLDLSLAEEAGEWLVVSGAWRRAEKSDFLE